MSIKNWWPFLAISFGVGLFFHLETLIYLPPAILILILISTGWNRLCLKDVSYERKWVFRRGFAGEEIPVSIKVKNDKPLPLLWLQTRDAWPRAVGPRDGDALTISHKPEFGYLPNFFHLNWFSSQKRSYQLQLRSRGYYRIGPVRLTSGDFFNLSENQKVLDQVDDLVVYPSIRELPDLSVQTRCPIGTTPSKRRMLQDHCLPYGIREYRPEDEFRFIHWNATAHTGTLQTRLFQPVTSRVMMICLNGTTSDVVMGGYYAEVLENLISLAASLIYRAHREGFSVGLLSNSNLVGGGRPFHIGPARTTAHLARLLEALAALQPITFNRFDNYILKEAHSIPYGSSLVILTSVVPEELLMSVIRLRKYHPNLTFISTHPDTPVEIAGVQTIHWPFVYEAPSDLSDGKVQEAGIG